MPNHHWHENCDFHADNTDTGPLEPWGNGVIMAFPVMEFQDQGYKIRKVFA